jgi:hypothetical protein
VIGPSQQSYACLQSLRVDVYGANWLQRRSLILGMMIETAQNQKMHQTPGFSRILIPVNLFTPGQQHKRF